MVLETTSDDVLVMEDTTPLPPVVTMMVEMSLVEEATRADVTVVLDVLLFVVVEADVVAEPAPPPLEPESEVMSEVGDVIGEVVVETIVVFEVMADVLPSEVVIFVVTEVDEETMVVLSAALPPLPLPDDPTVEVVVAPVPTACLLWKMPSSIGLSMMGFAAAAVDATTATSEMGIAKRMVVDSVSGCSRWKIAFVLARK